MPNDNPDLDAADVMELGRRYRRATGVRHVFKLPPDWMTVSILLQSTSQIDTPYPKYRLESDDGAYTKELSAQSDLVKGADYHELRFEALLPGKKYTLTRYMAAHLIELTFAHLDFMAIVDQPRDAHALLENHGYVASALGVGDVVKVEMPAPEED